MMPGLGDPMRYFGVLFAVLAFCILSGSSLFAEEVKPSKMLPPTVAQTYGPGNTIIMWHDTNNDGLADFKATYIFKDGRLVLIEKVIDKKLSNQTL
jgi:hypothetical protein